METEQFEALMMYVLVSGLMAFMAFIIWDLAKTSKAGRMGTAILFLGLGLLLLALLLPLLLLMPLLLPLLLHCCHCCDGQPCWQPAPSRSGNGRSTPSPPTA